MAALSDDELRAKTAYFKEKLANGSTLEDIKYEALLLLEKLVNGQSANSLIKFKLLVRWFCTMAMLLK